MAKNTRSKKDPLFLLCIFCIFVAAAIIGIGIGSIGSSIFLQQNSSCAPAMAEAIQKNTGASTDTVKEVVFGVYEQIPKEFPDGTFSPEDALAVAKIESNFDQDVIGKYGEIGVFQLLNPKSKDFSTSGNLSDFASELKNKYSQRKNFKLAIISYNGYTSKPNPSYWKRFSEARLKIQKIKDSIPACNAF